ncbi:MAK10-like protein [Tanacetum coccineum]
MGDENPIRTVGDYSKPSHEGYRNTIELPVGNNVVPLRSDTIRERTRLRLFQFSLRDQASNWLERLPAGSITHLGRSYLPDPCSFFPPGRTAKLRNDILMFQQHHGESLSEAWTHFKELLQKVPHHGIDLWLKYYMEDPEQDFVEYASLLTDEAEEGLVSNFMASQDARLSKFEADFKQQQNEMTNKINTVLKAITDRIAGALPSDTVKNPKLSTTPVLSARSYPRIDPQCASHPSNSINAIKAHFKEATISQTAYMIDMKKDPETPLLVGRGFLATANAVIDCRMAKIAVREGITRSVFGVKEVDLGEEEAPYWNTLGKRESYKPRPLSDGIGARTSYYARKDFLDCHLPGD